MNAAQQRIKSIIEKYALMAATNGYISPAPPPVKVRMVQKDAKSILLSLPRVVTLTVDLGPPHFTEEIKGKPDSYYVDATHKPLGAGVHELTFTAYRVEAPPTDESEASPEA